MDRNIGAVEDGARARAGLATREAGRWTAVATPPCTGEGALG